jgi:DNA-binding GntR family transcriptional regulator
MYHPAVRPAGHGSPPAIATATDELRPPARDWEPLTSTSLADEIAVRVEAAILDGTYAPGARIPQDDLCDRFGVSRTPVREALRKLQARNLVVVVPNKGATVRIPSRKELLDVYQVRAELEGYATELATSRFTDRTIADLETVQRRLVAMVRELGEREIGEAQAVSLQVQVNRANDDFHLLIHRTSGNERLYQLIEELGRSFPKEYVWRAVASSDEMETLNVEEHSRIRGALAAGDGEAARRAMREHILHARSVVLRHLDEHGFWS